MMQLTIYLHVPVIMLHLDFSFAFPSLDPLSKFNGSLRCQHLAWLYVGNHTFAMDWYLTFLGITSKHLYAVQRTEYKCLVE